ncbi:MAG: LysM peptidoglycan-binding domain-containing protein [bacterium]|nr:LysM peptidoglycan-binding domain-containing protein [bacterium]
MQMLNNDILISVVNLETGVITMIPWTPQKIRFRSGNMKWAEYDIMDVGEINEAVGRGLRGVSWTNGILPGPGHMNYPWQHAGLNGYRNPEHYQGEFSMWWQWKTPLLLIITNTPVCMRVKVDYYNITYQGAAGDYYYDISFKEDRNLTYVYAPRPDYTSVTERDTSPMGTTYVVKDDDTLWGIAECYLGSGMRYTELYDINAAAIEQAAAEHGLPDSCKGKYIYGGTTLKLPDSSSESRAGEAVSFSEYIWAYSDAYSNVPIARVEGPYYLYDGQNINNRYRVCRYKWECGKDEADGVISYWVAAEDISGG